ncbi:unnamed protein product, partial [Rotaria sp. Silwood1]
MALVLVPEQYVSSLFFKIGQDLLDAEQYDLLDLLKYFNNYWMPQMSFWNVHNLCQKANNSCE